MEYKRKADLNLHARKGLDFTIIRPGGLKDDPTDGKCELGKPQLGSVVSASSGLWHMWFLQLSKCLLDHAFQPRETVGETILAALGQQQATGRVWDLMSGTTPIEQAVEEAIKSDISSWHD